MREKKRGESKKVIVGRCKLSKMQGMVNIRPWLVLCSCFSLPSCGHRPWCVFYDLLNISIQRRSAYPYNHFDMDVISP